MNLSHTRITSLLLVIPALLLVFACNKQAVFPENQPNAKLFPDNAKVLFLGDSRVEGNSPSFESFRYELWKDLHDRNRVFDLIGSNQEGGTYSNYNGFTFDADHLGTGGAVTSDIFKTVKKEIKGDQVPNIVFLGIGGNDLTGGVSIDKAIKNINKIIDRLQLNNPHVVIFLEQIAPASSEAMTPELEQTLTSFNQEIASLAILQTNSGSHVIAVDMRSDWSDTYMADETHYNSIGAEVIASRYSLAMDAFFEN